MSKVIHLIFVCTLGTQIQLSKSLELSYPSTSLIFDITDAVKIDRMYVPSICRKVVSLNTSTSELIYIRNDGQNSLNILTGKFGLNFTNVETSGGFPSAGKSLLADWRNYCLLLNHSDTEYTAEPVVFNIFSTDQCRTVCQAMYELRTSLFVNFEFHEDCLNLFPVGCKEDFKGKQKAILVVSTTLQSTASMFSYAAFEREMTEKKRKYQFDIFNWFKEPSLSVLLYIRLSLDNSIIEYEKISVVRSHSVKLATEWLKNNDDVKIILDTVLPSQDNTVNNYIVNEEMSGLQKSIAWTKNKCNLQHKNITVWNVSNRKIYLPFWRWEYLIINETLLDFDYTCRPVIIFYGGVQMFHQNIANTPQNVANVLFTNVTLLLTEPQIFNNILQYDMVSSRQYFSKNCFNTSFNHSSFKNSCETRQLIPSLVLYKLTPNLYPFRLTYNDSALKLQLSSILIHRKALLLASDIKRSMKFAVMINIPTSTDQGMFTSGGCNVFYHTNLFCADQVQKSYELQETLHTWAKFHGFHAIVMQPVDDLYNIGRWFSISPFANFTADILAKFIVLARRNVPTSVDTTLSSIPHTYPCISNTDTMVPNLDSLGGKFVGVTINLNLPRKPSLSEKELQVLLIVALTRFQIIEVQHLKKNSLVPKLSKVLNNEFRMQLERQVQARNHNVFFEVDSSQQVLDTVRRLSSIPFLQVNVHIKNWDANDNNDFWIALRKLKSSKPVLLGISVSDCVNEINKDLTRIRKLLAPDIIDYIVCTMDGPAIQYISGNGNILQYYLDLQLYIKQYVLKELNVATYFRISLNYNCEIPEELKAYLKFLNITAQYASGHGVNYFATDAFVNCSWWEVENYNDLLNPSVYTERATGQKILGTLLDFPVIKDWISVGIAVGVALFFLLTTLFAFIYHRMKIKKFLTKDEVEKFVNGEEVEIIEESIALQYVQTSTVRRLGFNSDFEIPKSRIQLGKLIGSGFYGEVYKGTLRNSSPQTVAVKKSAADCTKDAFKTMLSETKVLSYLGSHDNVVRFIGAYTKEIDLGLIFIVMEYCENGALETYLGKAKRMLSKKGVNVICLENSSDYVDTAVSNITIESRIAISSTKYQELLKFSKEIASGMEYIAEKSVIHGDLSTRNVLLDSGNTCKITDFGLSRKLYERTAYIKQGDEALPWCWMAIESLKNKEFTTKSDVWSYGVLLWEIFTLGEHPYSGMAWDPSFFSRLENGLRLQQPEYATEEIYETMLVCWNNSPDELPSFKILRNFFERLLENEGYQHV